MCPLLCFGSQAWSHHQCPGKPGARWLARGRRDLRPGLCYDAGMRERELGTVWEMGLHSAFERGNVCGASSSGV